MIDGSGKILKQSNRLELDEVELAAALANASVGHNFLDLWRSDGDSGTHVAGVLEEILKGERTSVVCEHRYDTCGETRWLEVHAERLSGEQRGAVISQTDITGRKKAESENTQNRETVWHLNRVAALGELTASLAHEINQPLAAILNSAEAAAVLLNRSSPDIEETLEAIRDIIDDDKRAGAVISRMRSMLKRGYERTQAVDLSATVDETLRLVINEARLRRVALRHDAAAGLLPVVADPTQLQQVILNLITNAIEAVEIIPGYRAVEIRTALGSTNGVQTLEVRDNGPGIPVERLKTVFEPFYTSKREGLGLGLSICRSIVESFGGKITAESLLDGGAIFRVSLRTFVVAPEEKEQIMKAGA
jgi:C4-dicarboxylate-specific signal transduction histidine kinase